MTNAKKTPSKARPQKVKKIVKADVVKSVAIASVLLNILFFVALIVIARTNTFDYRFYSSAKDRYCSNVSAATERAEELGSEKAAITELQVNCVGKDFAPFYNEALQKYQAQVNQ